MILKLMSKRIVQKSKAGLLATLALRANLRLFKALRALVSLREDDDGLTF
jgi:hypothetical protein